MAIMDILNEVINPCELAKKKKEAYKEYVISILTQAKDYVENEDWGSLDKMCFESPAGDGYGMDNSVLNFAPDDKTSIDIMGAAFIIEYYNRVARGIIKPEQCYTTHELIDRASYGWSFANYTNGADLED